MHQLLDEETFEAYINDLSAEEEAFQFNTAGQVVVIAQRRT